MFNNVERIYFGLLLEEPFRCQTKVDKKLFSIIFSSPQTLCSEEEKLSKYQQFECYLTISIKDQPETCANYFYCACICTSFCQYPCFKIFGKTETFQKI